MTSTNLKPLIKVEESHHSGVGASSSERWMGCQGSNNLIKKLGQKARKSGVEAALGTATHTISQRCLERNEETWEYMGWRITVDKFEFECDKVMADSSGMYVGYVRKRYAELLAIDPNTKLYIEHWMTTILDDEAGGTGDAIIHCPKLKLLVVCDLKNGMVVVEPSKPQTRYYGALAIEELGDVEDVELVIIQPRLPHPKGPIRKLSLKAAEVTEWFTNTCVPAMEGTRDPDALLKVGEWCRFCPARDHCQAVQGMASELTAKMGLDPVSLEDDELGDMLTGFKQLEKAAEGWRAEALRRAILGARIKGQKLVKKQANRVFKESQLVIDPTDPEGKRTVLVRFTDAVVEKFGQAAYTEPTIKSPPKIEELDGGKAFVSRWAFTPDTGLTLAPSDDKRDAFVPIMQRLDAQVGEDRLRAAVMVDGA